MIQRLTPFQGPLPWPDSGSILLALGHRILVLGVILFVLLPAALTYVMAEFLWVKLGSPGASFKLLSARPKQPCRRLPVRLITRRAVAHPLISQSK